MLRSATKNIVIPSIPGHNHAYLPALGYPATNEAALTLLLGSKSNAIAEGRAFAAQVRKQPYVY